MMKTLRTALAIAATAGLALTSIAQSPASAPGTAMPMAGAGMAHMDPQMKAMREMHDKMAAAKTPEARNALMAEHMKLMQDGMAMMGGMGPMRGDMAARQQSMEKRMEMMQSMMQMMVDRMQAMPPATK